jgi:hypothetical protein
MQSKEEKTMNATTTPAPGSAVTTVTGYLLTRLAEARVISVFGAYAESVAAAGGRSDR